MSLACRSGLSDGACFAEVDFLNSLRFTGAQVFDVAGALFDTTITSASGFDYARGLPAHGGGNGGGGPGPDPSVIPLPASAVLLPAALGLMGGLGLWRRRRGEGGAAPQRPHMPLG